MSTCTDCAKPGVFWEGTPSGKVVKFGDVNTYVAEPSKSTGKAVLLVNDIYGYEAKNNRLLADKFAAAGFTAALPDVFSGDNPPLEALHKGDFQPFMTWQGRLTPELIIPRLDKVLDGLAADYGVKSVGTIGFCWGGRFSVILAGTDKVKAAVMNHGSFIDDDIIKGLTKPLLVNASDNDQQIPKEKLAHIQSLLEANKSVPSEVKFYEGMAHGWTCRGDAADPKVGPQIVDAFDRAAAWFQKHL